jgi:hypothetical protein
LLAGSYAISRLDQLARGLVARKSAEQQRQEFLERRAKAGQPA